MEVKMDMAQPQEVAKCVANTLSLLTRAFNAGVYGDVDTLPEVASRDRPYVYGLSQRWYISDESEASTEYKEAVRYILAYGALAVDPQYYGCMEPDTWLPRYVKDFVKEMLTHESI